MYNCTVVSTPGGVTVWQGEAFDCQNGEITLLHSQFATLSGATGECNNGDLVARSLGVEDSRYTSQLRVTVSTAITENMIMCVHDTSRGNILPQFNTTIPGLVTGTQTRYNIECMATLEYRQFCFINIMQMQVHYHHLITCMSVLLILSQES